MRPASLASRYALPYLCLLEISQQIRNLFLSGTKHTQPLQRARKPTKQEPGTPFAVTTSQRTKKALAGRYPDRLVGWV